jgi:hypothetical protein
MAWRLLQYKGVFEKFWAECTPAMQDALKPRLAQLLMKGNQATSPITEALGGGLFELRARCKKVRLRVLFGFLPGQRIVVVWCGTKDQRTLPQSTLKRARELLEMAKAESEKANVTYVN